MKMSGKLCKSLANTDFISHVYMTINIYKERKIAGKTGAVWENQHPDDKVELVFSFFFFLGGTKKIEGKLRVTSLRSGAFNHASTCRNREE